MNEPIVLVHGWSASSASLGNLAKFLQANLHVDVSTINLADWLSMNDEVTYADLVFALQKAWEARGDLAAADGVNIVSHSTGALVVREWMTKQFKDAECPIRRHLMLAPANFGSPLAHKGNAFLGRVVKGAKTGFQTGTHILTGLEIGSDYSWFLSLNDVFSERAWYGQSGILATVLVGNQGYGGAAAIVNEDGTDGTVRVSTANLNAARATIVFGPQGSVTDFDYTEVAPERQAAFGVLEGFNHSSITDPRSATTEHGRLILKALTIAPGEFSAWRDELERKTNDVYREAATRDRYFHAYQNTVVRAYDDLNNPVEEYLVEFRKGRRRGFSLEDIGAFFRRYVISDVHNFSANSAYRSFFLNVTEIEKGINDDLTMDIDPLPRCDGRRQPVGYTDVAEMHLDESLRSQLFQRNRTLLLDARFSRQLIREHVFDIRRLG